MNWLQSILYGLVSGIAEFLPISSEAHRYFLRTVFGVEETLPVQELALHFAALVAVLTCGRGWLNQLRRERKQSLQHKKHRKHIKRNSATYNMRFVRGASLVMLIGMILGTWKGIDQATLPLMCVYLVLNGIVLYIPEHMRHGNKSASAMTDFDSVLVGLFSALSVLPGISRVGVATSVSIARGADKSNAWNWALSISIPALILLMVRDVLQISVVSATSLSSPVILSACLCALLGYLGSCMGIALMRFLTVRVGYTAFAYYTWGTALFAIILFLI